MHQNNFGVLRHAAALAVLASHSVPLTYGTEVGELGMRATRQQMTIGHMAVFVFFILSGYLITQSWQRNPSPFLFARARLGRLLPGLALSLVGCTAAGLFLTSLPATAYLTDPLTARFIWLNLSLLDFTGLLPGVFTASTPPAVNGSLWTLHFEAACYVLVVALGLAGLLRRWVVLALLVCGVVAAKYWLGGSAVEFGTGFVGGMVLALWRPPVRVWALLLCAAMLGVTAMTGGFRLACATAGAYLVIAAATSRPWRVKGAGSVGAADGADYSYGIYLWAFPVQQLVSSWGVAHWVLNIAISLPIVLACAWVSWHAVERPVLQAIRRARSDAAMGRRAPDAVGGVVG